MLLPTQAVAKGFRALVILSLGVFGGAPSFASEHFSDHQQVCQNRPDCLAFLKDQLSTTKPESAAWFKIQSYLLDLLFDKQDFAALRYRCELLLAKQPHSEVFRAQLHFYYAKSLAFFGERENARNHAFIAHKQLNELFQSFADPLRLIELGNLEIWLGEHEQAYDILNAAQSRYNKSKDPLFWFELNSNFALIYDKRQQLELSEEARTKALEAIMPTGETDKIATAMGNLARTKQLRGDYANARKLYEQSLAYLTSKLDDKIRSIYLLRLSEISMAMHDKTAAKAYFDKVDPSLIDPHSHLIIYQALQKNWQD